MKLSVFTAGLISILSWGFGYSASSQMIDASDPFSIVGLIQQEGYQAKLESNESGDPKISGRLDSLNWNMIFYSCQDNRNCASVQLVSAFDLPDGMSMERVNEFNRNLRWADVDLDEEGDPFLRMDINLAFGVSEDNFKDSFDWWRIMLAEFATFIDW